MVVLRLRKWGGGNVRKRYHCGSAAGYDAKFEWHGECKAKPDQFRFIYSRTAIDLSALESSSAFFSLTIVLFLTLEIPVAQIASRGNLTLDMTAIIDYTLDIFWKTAYVCNAATFKQFDGNLDSGIHGICLREKKTSAQEPSEVRISGRSQKCFQKTAVFRLILGLQERTSSLKFGFFVILVFIRGSFVYSQGQEYPLRSRGLNTLLPKWAARGCFALLIVCSFLQTHRRRTLLRLLLEQSFVVASQKFCLGWFLPLAYNCDSDSYRPWCTIHSDTTGTNPERIVAVPPLHLHTFRSSHNRSRLRLHKARSTQRMLC